MVVGGRVVGFGLVLVGFGDALVLVGFGFGLVVVGAGVGDGVVGPADGVALGVALGTALADGWTEGKGGELNRRETLEPCHTTRVGRTFAGKVTVHSTDC